MRNQLGETALFRSVRYGKEKVFKFLARKISGYNLANQQLFLQRSDRSTILHVAIVNEHFEMFPHLVGERDADGMTDLQLLSCDSGAFKREDKREFFQQIVNFDATCTNFRTSSIVNSYFTSAKQRKPTRYESASKLAKFLIERDLSWEATYFGIDQGKPTLHKFGCIDIAKEILKCYPQAIGHIDDKGRNILHIAIGHCQLEIFNLVKKKEVPMKRLVRKFDSEGNSILHVVGLKKRKYVAKKISGPALELRDEMLWFESSRSLYMFLMVFVCSVWRCTVVAVLIATVAFAAAYTVPGGPNIQTGAPILVNKPFFVVFTVTDILSLSFALTSVVIFLSIVSSPFRLIDFKESLPKKLMLGFTFLFLSVSMMMFALAATVLLMIQNRESWTKVILYALSFLPVGIFALSYFPLYASLSETYNANLLKFDVIFFQYLTYEVETDIYMLCSRVVYLILGQMDCTLTITVNGNLLLLKAQICYQSL
ncbi:hypothetical protein I3760_09G096300 [Carya illinoinensis]|nr:hypothetical protein I3760_09G096300 [Carya illinoinensis]